MSTKIYKCFVASPGDTAGEREICDKVFSEINQTFGESFGFRVEAVKWENDAVPGFGSDGQDVINSQLTPGEHDFFIGIMWKKFGTPTPRAGSGTEEEFNQAYEKWNGDNTQKIQFYFNVSAPENLAQIDTDQLDKVNEFQKKISALGGLYCPYKGEEDFEGKFRKNITTELLTLCGGVSGELDSIRNVSEVLLDRLHGSLSLFSSQPVTWLDRILCENDAASATFDESRNKSVPIDGFIDKNVSCVVKAPPQFGLTSLSHYMIKEAWDKGLVWVYLDFDKVKVRKLEATIRAEAEFFSAGEINCIVLDSWGVEKNGSQKILEVLTSLFPETRVVLMQTVMNSLEVFEATKVRIDREFEVFNLLALPKREIRKTVTAYGPRISGDENTVLDKLVLDIDTLNIHRTPMNCWTLLKVAERNFDKSPVNRTQMLELVLIVLFNLNDIPRYKSVPDSKDCEHALGYFCERLIRASRLVFTKQLFIASVQEFCDEKLVDIEVDTLFDILTDNRIIISVTSSELRFKASFWVYYFAAKRMTNDEVFKNYILTENRYALYPEIIEFYTGIDRNKTDVLEILRADLSKTRSLLDAKLAITAKSG